MSSFLQEPNHLGKRATGQEQGNGESKRAALGNLTNTQFQPPAQQSFRPCASSSSSSIGLSVVPGAGLSSSTLPQPISQNGWMQQTTVSSAVQPASVMSSIVPVTQFGSVNITTPTQNTSLQMEIDLITSFEAEDADPFDNYTTTQGYLMDAQRNKLPQIRYMETFQTDINAQMREILIDWLVEVTQEYRLKVETLHLAVNYIDRFLGVQRVFRNQLQLVGVSCMLIAAKYEEIYPPPVDDFVFITDSTYTREEVILMESRVLDRLRFELTVVTPNLMMSCFVRNLGVDCTERMQFLAKFLMDLTHQDYSFVGFLPSIIAASALSVACFTLNGDSWPTYLAQAVPHTRDELRQCASAIHAKHIRINPPNGRVDPTRRLRAVSDVFAREENRRVAEIPGRNGYFL